MEEIKTKIIPEETIANIFDSISKKMMLEFEVSRNTFSHNGLKGSANEVILIDFLRKYLPKKIEITSGQIIDTEGHISKQIDIILCDSFATPMLYEINNIRVIPIETVYAVIEVKAIINSSDVETIINNMLSVKKLIKKAFYKKNGIIKSTINMFDREWEIWPVHYYIFGFTSENAFSVRDEINRFHSDLNLQPWERIDTGCILDKGAFINTHRDGELIGKIDALPSNNTDFYFMPSRRPLIAFYTLIMHYLNQAEIPDFAFTPYLGKLQLE